MIIRKASRKPSARLWASAAAAAALVAAIIVQRARRPARIGHALIVSADDHTVYDGECGVRSVQGADLILPTEAVDSVWSPRGLERLARTYWRYLSHVTLGLIQIDYQEHGRQAKFLGLVPLLTFQAPEYEMNFERGIVRWRIERGILVATQGRGGAGYLEIDIQRRPSADYDGRTILHVEVEVSNFYPAIANWISRWFYENTQSRIHVFVTHGFLRSLARLDLAESKVGRFADLDTLPTDDRDLDGIPEPRAARDRLDESDGLGLGTRASAIAR